MRRYPILFLAVVSLLGAACGRRGELERVPLYTQYHGVTFGEKFKVWATGADEAVDRRAFYEPQNYIFDGKTVRLGALRGETEAFQLVVNADYGNINDVTVVPGELRGPGGATIPAANVDVFFEYYLNVKTPSGPGCRAGAVADALPPLREPFDLAKAEAQPLFVVIRVPAETPPGEYEGVITVNAKGAAAQQLGVKLAVVPQLLDASLLPPAFLEPDYAAWAAWAGHAGRPLSPKELSPYYDLLAARRCYPLDGGYAQRRLTAAGARAAKEWAKGAAAVTPTFFYLSPQADGRAPGAAVLATEYERLYEACGKTPPREPVVWFAFPGGSPAPFEAGAAAFAWWGEMRKAAAAWPGRPALAAAASPLRGAPGVDLGPAGGVWAAPCGDVAACPERYARLRGGGRYYLRLDGSGADVVDGRRAGARLLSWYGYLWGAAGLLGLAPPADAVRPANPWQDELMSGTAAAYGNGLGLWCYPGAPAGVEGPVTSARLELLRQGLEDWVLFRLAERKLGREYVAERLMALLPYDVGNLNDVEARDLGTNQLYELRMDLLSALAGKAAPGRDAPLAGRVTDAPGAPVYHARVGDATFATYTDEAGGFRLRYRGEKEAPEAEAPGSGRGDAGAAVTLRRGLRGLEPVYDFEGGVDPALWLAGEKTDALAAAEERELVHEGRIALSVAFPCGRVSRVVNLYPRQKDFGPYNTLEFDLYNPNDFIVDVWFLVLDDPAADVDQQFRQRITLRPRGWTRVSYRLRSFADGGEGRYRPGVKGGITIQPAYRPEMSNVIGFGFEADGLAAAGGKGNAGSYRVIVDNFKVVKFE